jgi:hypothetical protein
MESSRASVAPYFYVGSPYTGLSVGIVIHLQVDATLVYITVNHFPIVPPPKENPNPVSKVRDFYLMELAEVGRRFTAS